MTMRGNNRHPHAFMHSLPWGSLSQVAIIPRKPTTRKTPSFFYTRIPTRLHRKSYRIAHKISTGYIKTVYRIGQEEFRGENSGVDHNKHYEEVGSIITFLFPSKLNKHSSSLSEFGSCARELSTQSSYFFTYAFENCINHLISSKPHQPRGQEGLIRGSPLTLWESNNTLRY